MLGRLLWLGVKDCVFLTQQMRQSGDHNKQFRDLLDRLRCGTTSDSDIRVLSSRTLAVVSRQDWFRENILKWASAPIITSRNNAKDALNFEISKSFASRTRQQFDVYNSLDSHNGNPVKTSELREALGNLHSGQTGQLLGRLPLIPGMPVVVTQNYDVSGGVVNGMQGILKSVKYETGLDGTRYATSCVITSPSVDCSPLPYLDENEVVALRETTSFSIRLPTTGKNVTIKRTQLPVFPAFAMTDYKAQGKTMPLVIVDLESSRSRQSAYVMLSRATSLENLLVLRPFKRSRLTKDFSEDLKKETERLNRLSSATLKAFKQSNDWKHRCASKANPEPDSEPQSHSTNPSPNPSSSPTHSIAFTPVSPNIPFSPGMITITPGPFAKIHPFPSSG